MADPKFWNGAITRSEIPVRERLIRQEAVGLNFIDVYFRTGLYPAPQGLPLVPGNEAAGVGTAVGEGVSLFKEGDRIAYAGPIGAYAQERVIEAAKIVKVPDDIALDVAASMMLKGMTAEYLLRRTYDVKPGDTILYHAAAGGVGLIVGQWAKALGATVIGTVGSARRRNWPPQMAMTTSSITGPRILSRGSGRSPAARVPTWFMTPSARTRSRVRSTV
jgi:NADPH:quinone reductase-like Zn-dependent oxidoreductase